MADRYDENRERFEGGRSQDAGRRGEFERGYQGGRSYYGQGRGRGDWGESDYRGRGENHGEYEGRGGYRENEGWQQGYSGEPGYGRGSRSEEGRYGWGAYGSSGHQGRYGDGRLNEGREAQFAESHYGEGPYGESRRYGEGGRYGEQREQSRYSEARLGGRIDEDWGNRGWSQRGNRDYGEGGQDWDRYRERSMTVAYPRENEWSGQGGVGLGLGGAENSEYSAFRGSGGYYGGQGQFSGGASRYGGGLGQYGRESGRHAGRGPKGYKRSDDRIKEDVNEWLTRDSQIDAAEIEVQVRDGEVTLTGTVESRAEKRRAEDIIENLFGVREVHNQLRVQHQQPWQSAPSGQTGQPSSSQPGQETAASKQAQQSREHAAASAAHLSR